MTDVDEVFSLYTPETWGPQTPADWEETDQLSRELLRRQHGRTAASSASLFASWLRLPSLMRRRAWRQREIGAQLFEIEDAVSNVPGLHGIGVGVRLAEERPRLVVVVSSDANFSAPPRWPIGLPTFIKVGTLIPEMGDLDLIPIVIEYESRPVQLSSQDIIENGPCPPDHEPTLQTGLEVGGEDAAGLIETGSLSAIVRNASGERV